MLYVCTDLHGCGDVWNKVKSKLTKEDKLIFLGDAVDRGPDGLAILKDMLENPQVEMLKGNHEEMLNDIMHEYMEGHTYSLSIWFSNGGSKTFDDFINLSLSEQQKLLSRIDNLPIVKKLSYKGNIIYLSHSGAYSHLDEENKNLSYRKKSDKCLWDRDFFTKLNPNDLYENEYLIGGHTPVQLIDNTLIPNPEIYVFNNGHCIDLDLCTILSNKVALFCIDTWTVDYIE